MLWRVATLIASIVMGVNGFQLMAMGDCESVSFDGQAGRVFTLDCYPDSTGAVPRWLASTVLLGGAIALFGLWRYQVRLHRDRNRLAARWTPAVNFEESAKSWFEDPEYVLLMHSPTDHLSNGRIFDMLHDYIGDEPRDETRQQAAIRPPSPDQQLEIERLAEELLDGFQIGGVGLVHATFMASLLDMTGLEMDQQLLLHRAISSTASSTIEFLMGLGRVDDAYDAGVIAATLYLNAQEWTDAYTTWLRDQMDSG